MKRQNPVLTPSLSAEQSSVPAPPVVPKQPVSVPPPAENNIRKVSGRQQIATPSIFGMLNSDGADGVNEPLSKAVNGQGKELLNQSFTSEELKKVWKQFVERVDAPQLKSALASREPILNENWKIEYLLDNDLQLQRITLDLKPKLIGFLHRTLKNETIEIDFKVSVNNEDIAFRPYTEAEKWNALVEKYPALADLKTKFNLDFEHL